MKKTMFAVFMMFMSTFAWAELKPFTVCTGGVSGAYEGLGDQIGKDIARKIGTTAEILNTGGSIENAEMLMDGDCYMAIMQGDAAVSRSLPASISISSAHTEAIFWIVGNDGVIDFEDLTKKENQNKAVAIVSGSGAEVTLKNFGNVDKDYKDVRTVEFDDWYLAAEAAAQGYTMKAKVRVNVAGLLYVGRPGFVSTDITEDFRERLKVGEIDESSFAKAKDTDGNQLYYTCKLDEKMTNGIKTTGWRDPATYCMKAVVVYNEAYTDGLDKKQAREVKRAVARGINGTLKTVK